MVAEDGGEDAKSRSCNTHPSSSSVQGSLTRVQGSLTRGHKNRRALNAASRAGHRRSRAP
eukprot:1919611-Rhodomonas_salina.1